MKDNIEQPAPLTESYRSSPAIMEAVNAVFDQAKIMETHFGHTVTSRWKKAWKPHFSNPSLSNDEGFATWIDVNKWDKFNEETHTQNTKKLGTETRAFVCWNIR